MHFQQFFRLRNLRASLIFTALVLPLFFLSRAHSQQPAETKPQDPAAWGGNHAGQKVPEFVRGDECLFCHRNTTGASWQKNAHGLTIRQRDDAPTLHALLKQPPLAAEAGEIDHFLGSRHHIRFLKKVGYGKCSLLGTRADLDAAGNPVKWVTPEKPGWDQLKFADRCAGCHATGIDQQEKTFVAYGLDCYSCHGNVTLDHTNNTALMILSKKRRQEAQVITSLCAQCHLREGRSKSTGLPYPNNFIAGDNLFQDFVVDWAKADDESLNPGDRHIYRNARDVAVYGKTTVTCVSCHQVHAETRTQALARHKLPPRGPICFDCHVNESPLKAVKPYVVTSRLCEY